MQGKDTKTQFTQRNVMINNNNNQDKWLIPRSCITAYSAQNFGILLVG